MPFIPRSGALSTPQEPQTAAAPPAAAEAAQQEAKKANPLAMPTVSLHGYTVAPETIVKQLFGKDPVVDHTRRMVLPEPEFAPGVFHGPAIPKNE